MGSHLKALFPTHLSWQALRLTLPHHPLSLPRVLILRPHLFPHFFPLLTISHSYAQNWNNHHPALCIGQQRVAEPDTWDPDLKTVPNFTSNPSLSLLSVAWGRERSRKLSQKEGLYPSPFPACLCQPQPVSLCHLAFPHLNELNSLLEQILTAG